MTLLSQKMVRGDAGGGAGRPLKRLLLTFKTKLTNLTIVERKVISVQ